MSTKVVHLERQWLNEPATGNAFISAEISTQDTSAGYKIVTATVDLFEYNTVLHLDFSAYDRSELETGLSKLAKIITVLTRFRESLNQAIEGSSLPPSLDE